MNVGNRSYCAWDADNNRARVLKKVNATGQPTSSGIRRVRRVTDDQRILGAGSLLYSWGDNRSLLLHQKAVRAACEKRKTKNNN